MSYQRLDLWPDSIVTSELRAPVTILREQATFLGKKTRNMVLASVRTMTDPLGRFRPGNMPEPGIAAHLRGGKFAHAFQLVVPALEDYAYTLFRVEHGIDFYPAEFHESGRLAQMANSEDELIDILRQILSSENTLRIIASLIAQVETS